MKIKKFLFLIMFLGLLFSVGFTSPLDLSTERSFFLKAKQAALDGNRFKFFILANQLRDYPLYPYLVFIDITQRLNKDEVSEKEILKFLKYYNDTVLGDRLRDTWLFYLAKKNIWLEYLKYYQESNNSELQGKYAQALLNTNQSAMAFRQLSKVWLTGKTLSEDCENLFKIWQQSGNLSSELIWKRAQLAIASGNNDLLDKLKKWSPADQKNDIQLWESVSQNPKLLNNPSLFQPITSHRKEIVLDGFLRWSKLNSNDLIKLWPQLKNAYSLNNDERQQIIKAIAIALARDNNEKAVSWLNNIDPAYVDKRVREWRIRSALAQQNWVLASARLEQLPAEEKKSECWKYWEARVKKEKGDTNAGEKIFRELSTKLDYYGVLASSQLCKTYQLPNKSITENYSSRKLFSIPAIRRAIELYSLQLVPDARREWQWAISRMDQAQLLAAANLAYQLRWYDRAIAAVAKAKDFNNVTIRFPLAYSQDILIAAKKNKIEPAWILAIARQESNFMPDAKSNVGALGLMQLMPATAKLLAKMNISDQQLLNSTTNIALGTQYLKELLVRYKGNLIMATAAYNLGPTRLKKWLPLYQDLPNDIWVEILPWQETRDYIKAVMLGKAVYEQKR